MGHQVIFILEVMIYETERDQGVDGSAGGDHRSDLCLHPYALMENYGD